MTHLGGLGRGSQVSYGVVGREVALTFRFLDPAEELACDGQSRVRANDPT
jgi:hypothetical protein